MLTAKLKSVFSADRRFNRDVLWNVGSLAVLGLSGVVINVMIARDPDYGDDALGVFNQVFAFYIVLSQIAVAGVHLSALKHVSHNQDDREKCAAISSAAFILAGVMGLVVCGAAFLLRDWVGYFWKSPGISVGIGLIAPGLLLFAVNKVLISVVNGMRHMRAYAVFNGLRFVLIVLALIVMIRRDVQVNYLAASLSIAEAVLFLALFVYVNLRVTALWPTRETSKWFKPHLDFGLRGFLSGMLSEMNTRVDILMLGFFESDAIVGLYSFAAIPAEAFAQLTMVIRRNVDPIIGAHFAKGELDQIHDFARRVKRMVYAAMAVIGAAAVIAYPFAVKLFVADQRFAETWPFFAILTLGIVLRSGYVAFYGVLLQGGRPGMHTLFVAGVVLSNVILNAALIPLLGLYGAAIATSVVFVLEAFLIHVFAKRLLNIRL